MKPGAEGLGGLERVHGSCHDLDPKLDQWTAVCCEVNQLLTAIRSPIASVEQHGCPRSGDGGDHIARFAVVFDAHDRWQLRAVLKNVHESNLACAAPEVRKVVMDSAVRTVRHSVMELEENRSVRVEILSVEDERDAPAAPPRERRTADSILIGVGGALLLVALILAVRPSNGESADGSIRTAPTTVAPSTTIAEPSVAEPVDTAALDDVEDVQDEDLYRKVQGLHQGGVSSVVRADVGYLAASWDGTLHRSIDGIEWSAVDIEFPEEVERARQYRLSLGNLRRTATGYAALALLAGHEGSSPTSSVIRLESRDGKVWEIQATVESTPETLHAYPVLHTDSMWAYVSVSTGALVRELLDTHLVDGQALLDVQPCWLEASSEDAAQLYECAGGAPIYLTADDFAEGVSLRQLARCVEWLQGSGLNKAQFIDVETGESIRTIEFPQRVQLSGGVSDRGAVVGVDANLSHVLTSSCDGLIDVPEADPGPVMIWDEDSADARHIAFPEGVNVNGWAPSYVRGDSLIMLAVGQVWTLDLTSLEWNEGPEVGRSVDAGYLVSEDGNTIVSVAFTNDVTVTDMGSLTTRTIETDLPGQIYWIVYADDDIAIVDTSLGTYWIDLTAG